MKNFISLMLVFSTLLTLLGCVSAKTDVRVPTYDANGAYTGFSDIPEVYNAETATKDACVVIRHEDLKDSKYPYTAGYENFESFIKKAAKGKNCFVRVAHFIGDVCAYTDIYHINGKYHYFKLNEYGIDEPKSFNYLCRLESEYNENKFFYVLTDSMELSYSDVEFCMVGADITKATKIPFVWLGFTVYFEKGDI